LKPNYIHPAAIVLALLLVLGPVFYAKSIEGIALLKSDMITFYQTDSSPFKRYAVNGEFIPRTGAWLSVLIIIFTLVKARTLNLPR
jgi:hypothetical protein